MSSDCTGVILAGGGATRYGGKPKGLECLNGERIIDRVARVLSLASDNLLLISNDPAACGWLPGVRTEPDVRTGLGSLGGIYSALVLSGSPVMLVAWDMPFVPAALLKRLRLLGAGMDVAVAESGSRRGLEPLCAYYTPACIPAIERRLDSADLRVVGFYEDVRVARLSAAEVAQFGGAERLFMNVNTPADLILAERYASTTDGDNYRQEE